MNARIEYITIIGSVLIYFIAYVVYKNINSSELAIDDKLFQSGLTFLVCGILLLPVTTLLSIKHYKKIINYPIDAKASILPEHFAKYSERILKGILTVMFVVFPFLPPLSIIYVSYIYFKL